MEEQRNELRHEQEVQLPEPKEDRQIVLRLNVLFLFVFFIFAVLVVRLSLVQLVHGEEYRELSASNQSKSLPITAPRGRIVDSQDKTLVDNKAVYSVTFHVLDAKLQDYEAISRKLASLLQLDAEEVLKKMDVNKSSQRMSSYIPRRIKTDIPVDVAAYIEEHQRELPGVEVSLEPMREYKYGTFASHILGYTQPVPESQKDSYLAQGYRADDRVGVYGLEQQYETQLRGRDGERAVVVNSQYETVGVQKVTPPVRGNDLVLTFDYAFQKRVEQILEESVLSLQKSPETKSVQSATAVVLNPHTGAVLALANYPRFNPNVFNLDVLSNEVYQQEVAGKDKNLAVGGGRTGYEPGSTIKPATVMMGLKEGVITPKERINDPGSIRVGRDKEVRSWRRSGFGPITAAESLKHSSNVFMVNIGLRLINRWSGGYTSDLERLNQYYEAFGLGKITGIDLPEETIGIQFTPKPAEILGRMVDLTYGQFHLYTPIQLAQYVSGIANGGWRLQPYVVQEVREGVQRPGEKGRVLYNHEPKVLNRFPVDPEHVAVAQEGMKLVASPGGTAYSVYNSLPFQVAAKTGTAQTGRAHDNSLIVGYAPYDKPEMAFVVVVPSGGGGSAVSGPISRKIIEAFFGLEDPPEDGATQE